MLCRVTFEGAMPKKFQQKSWFTEGNYPGIERTKRVTTGSMGGCKSSEQSTNSESLYASGHCTHTLLNLIYFGGGDVTQGLDWSLVVHWHRHRHTHTHTHAHKHIPEMVGKFILTISDRFDVASICHLLNGDVGQNISTISSYIENVLNVVEVHYHVFWIMS